MNDDERAADRRERPRWPVKAEVTVMADGRWLGSHICENLSAGGMLLVGPRGLHVGDELEVVLRLPELEPIEVRVQVCRRHERSQHASAYGVRFSDLPADAEDLIHNMVLAQLEGRTPDTAELVAVS